MKVFKFAKEGRSFTIASSNKEDARNHLLNEYGVDIRNCFEIPESDWSNKDIKMHVDNDMEKEMFHVSITDIIPKAGVQLLATTDSRLLYLNTSI